MDKSEPKWPRCPECGGRVMMRGGVGRTREFRRGVHLPVPDEFELPTCEGCGEILMAPEVSEPLDALLAARYPKVGARES